MNRLIFSLLLLVLGLVVVACTTPDNAQPRTEETSTPAQPTTLPQPPRIDHAVVSEQAVVSPARAVADVLGIGPGRQEDGHWPPADYRRDRDQYQPFDSHSIRRAAEHPVSTFSIDVDTASYANVRRMLQGGRLPPRDAVRVEEMINYFRYDYPVPEAGEEPFSVSVEQAVTPWNDRSRLLQIGIRGFQPPPEDVPPANLVFLIDVSGSMAPPDRLPLVINGLKLLTAQLGPEDRVAIVVYAGQTGIVLESTPGSETARINAALDRLRAAGATNGGDGIRQAYALARQGYIEGGINRVILATDGDFNVGTASFEALLDLVREQRASGVSLTTLGVGRGNYNDRLMDQLAAVGNGNSAYIDTLAEARKVLVEERHATLMTIASDVKIQVEFNPAVVAEYRLIGYENRLLQREDFNNDQVDAGDIGANHTVTALYEVTLVGSGGERVDPLRYGGSEPITVPARADELAFVRLRYKAPEAEDSRLIETPVRVDRLETDASDDLAFAAAVAAFGQHLRGGEYLERFALSDIHALASRSRGPDAEGYRGEFLQLIRLAESLSVAQR